MKTSRERLMLSGISKAYPGCLANDAIHLTLYPGEIHALLGENGAGKSTLMKIIYGLIRPDEGEICFDGKQVDIQSPAHARELGIGMVFQHFSLFETLSVTENIALALGKTSGSRRELAAQIARVSEEYGMAIQPEREVHSLSVGERQRVEIVRCLVQSDMRLLILDEPTSVLTPQEVERLFMTLRRLAQEGCAILFISHKLQEVKDLCHRATILRGGRVVGSCQPQETPTETLARLMVGEETILQQSFKKAEGGAPRLEVRNLTHISPEPFGTDLHNISFSLGSGEILGIAGVAGNGQEELLAALSGEAHCDQAQAIYFEDQAVGHLSPDQRRRAGLGCVPEERLGRGAVPEMSLADNALLTASACGLLKQGWLRPQAIQDFSQKIIQTFQVRTTGTQAYAQSLSGGNLQKFILGREMLQHPRILIAAHPTWGVDVGAANLIHRALIELRDQGAAILVISEDLDELFLISDRLGALCDGRLSPIQATAHTSLEEVGRWMAGDFTSACQADTSTHFSPQARQESTA